MTDQDSHLDPDSYIHKNPPQHLDPLYKEPDPEKRKAIAESAERIWVEEQRNAPQAITKRDRATVIMVMLALAAILGGMLL